MDNFRNLIKYDYRSTINIYMVEDEDDVIRFVFPLNTTEQLYLTIFYDFCAMNQENEHWSYLITKEEYPVRRHYRNSDNTIDPASIGISIDVNTLQDFILKDVFMLEDIDNLDFNRLTSLLQVYDECLEHVAKTQLSYDIILTEEFRKFMKAAIGHVKSSLPQHAIGYGGNDRRAMAGILGFVSPEISIFPYY